MTVVGSHVSLGAPSGQRRIVARACRMNMSILRRAVMCWQTFHCRISGAETVPNCQVTLPCQSRPWASLVFYPGRDGRAYPGNTSQWGSRTPQRRGSSFRPPAKRSPGVITTVYLVLGNFVCILDVQRPVSSVQRATPQRVNVQKGMVVIASLALDGVVSHPGT